MQTWKQILGISLCAGAAAVGVRLGTAWSAQSVPAAGGVTIAVVNLNRLVNQLKEKDAYERKLRTVELNFQSAMRKKQAAMKKTAEVLNPRSPFYLKPGTRAFQKRENTLLKENLDARSFAAYHQQMMGLKKELELQSLYHQINIAIRQYAKKHNISLVLVKDPQDIQNYNLQGVQQAIASRKVLYASRAINITTSVVERMNAAYIRANPH